MANIIMCDDHSCPLAETCYRNEQSGTIPNRAPAYQARFTKSPRTKSGCDFYIVANAQTEEEVIAKSKKANSDYWPKLDG